MTDETTIHWADAAANRLLARGDLHVLNTGITPSGPIHVGNSREILTADAVHRALRARGAASVLNYIADSFDPLRRVYPFLDEATYAEHVGKPLSQIPCPCSGDEGAPGHTSYAEHFLVPFLEGAESLGVDLTLIRAHELYAEGAYAESIFDALEGREAIARILNEETGKEVGEDWSPFHPLCPDCGRLGRATVRAFDRGAGTVRAACLCGWEGDVAAAGGGKLTWRVDWPARWKILGCTFEPFGKDHATKGGSWDTGRRIAREVFDYEPPDHLLYEWISLKGLGDMSSSKGNVLSIGEMLEVAPPEVFRFLIMDRQPQRAIELDPGRGVVTLIGEYDRRAQEDPEDRAYELSRVSGDPPCSVPFPHLVTTVQIAEATLAGRAAGEEAGGEGAEDGEEEGAEEALDREILAVLQRSGHALEDSGERRSALSRARYAARWVRRFGPEEMRFRLRQELPDEISELTEGQRNLLGLLAARLREPMNGVEVHDLIHEAREEVGIKPAAAFQAVYLAFLGTRRGPRAGAFLASLNTEWARARLQQAAGGTS